MRLGVLDVGSNTVHLLVVDARVGGPPAPAASKTFRSLGQIAGSAPSSEGPYVRRRLLLADLNEWVEKLAEMTPAQRAELPGVSRDRADQLLAGATCTMSRTSCRRPATGAP